MDHSEKEAMRSFIAERAQSCKVLVVGDVMLDKYYYGEVTRISPEAPVPITRVTRMKETLGGAANVAHNLALLGCQTSIAGFVGEDEHCRSLLSKFSSCGIDQSGLIRTERPTTTKLRVIGGHQQMLRLDFEEASAMGGEPVEAFLRYIEGKLCESLDCLVISDYGKGACTEETCQEIIKKAHAHGVPVIIDPKGPDWTRYKAADYVTPNLKEINEVIVPPITNEDAEVERAARYLMRKYKIKNIIATRSERGITLVTAESKRDIPTKSQEVFDVSGAGDTVIAVFAMALSGGLSPETGAYLANLAASVVVAKLGTYAVSREELLQVLEKTVVD